MSCSITRYAAPKIIPGLDFTEEEIRAARRAGAVLSLDLEITSACNASCRYCYRYLSEGPQPPAADELTAHEIAAMLKDARSRNGLKRLCILGGEPLLKSVRPKYRATLEACNQLGIRHVTFTNGLCLDDDTARMLADHQASVCIKLNGMDEETHDRLVGVQGAFAKAMQAFDRLMSRGYGTDPNLQLAFETVVTQWNYSQIEAMWVWARDRGILPYVEKLTVQGRAASNAQDLLVTNEMVQAKFVALNVIDRTRFGTDWHVKPPIAGGFHCIRFFISLYIRSDGLVCPCVGVDMNVGNVRQQSISDIVASPIVGITRNIDRHIKGKCRDCDLSASCYGCRGAAYQNGDLFAEDPVCWREPSLLCAERPLRAGPAADAAAKAALLT